MSGRTITGWFKKRHLRGALAVLSERAIAMRAVFLERFEIITRVAEGAYSRGQDTCSARRRDIQGVFGRIFFPRVMAKFYSMARNRLSAEWRETMAGYDALRKKAAGLDGREGGLLIYAQGAGIVAGDLVALTAYQAVEVAAKQVERERMRIR